MGKIGNAYVAVDGDYSKLTKGAKKGISPALKIASAAIAVGIGVALKGAITEGRESIKVGKQTAAVLKSTGGAAKVSAKQISDLANAISLKVGVDDEAIQSGENLLLTFKGVRNEAGKGNDIFSQATQAIVDMTAAMNNGKVTTEGLKGSTIMIGKALQDPIKGMTTLRRVGVMLSDSQTKQVKSLVESGDKMKAQKIILRELNSEFKGSAAAQADPFDKFNVAVKNLQETIGIALLPTLQKAADAATVMIGQIQSGEGTFGRAANAVKAIAEAFNSLPGPLKAVLAVSAAAGAGFLFGGQFGAAAAAIAAVGLLIAKNWEPISAVFNRVKTAVMPTLTVIGQGARDAAGWVSGAFNTIKTSLNLTGGDVGKFGQGMVNAFNIAKAALGVLATYWTAVFQGVLLPVVKRVLPGIQQIVQGVFRTLGGIVKVFAGILTLDFGKAWEGVKQIFSGQLKVVGGILRAASAPLRVAAAFAAKGVWAGIKGAAGGAASAGKWIIDKVRDAIAGAWHAFFSVGAFLFKKIKDGLWAGVKSLGSIGKSIGNAIKSGIGTINPFGAGLKIPTGLGHEPGNFGKVTALARGFGDIITSGYRPGDPGWHGKNRARDYAGGNMLGFAKAAAAKFGSGLLELIHTPLGYGIKNGRKVPLSFWGSAVNMDHGDHVHVAMQRGGKAGPSQGGPSVVYGEGKKTEWWISQEGDKKKNLAWAAEAVSSLAGNRLSMFAGGGRLGASAIKSLWQKVGGSKKLANIMAAIALAESGGNLRAVNHNTDGSTDYGLWQINSVHGFKPSDMFNTLKNSRAAKSVLAKQGLGAWATYNSGAYKKFMAAAKGAVPKAKKKPKIKTKAKASVPAEPRSLSGDVSSKWSDWMSYLDNRVSVGSMTEGRHDEFINAALARPDLNLATRAALTGDLSSGGGAGGEDPNQALIDAQNAAAEAANAAAEAARAQAEAAAALTAELKSNREFAEKTHAAIGGEVHDAIYNGLFRLLGGRSSAGFGTATPKALYA